MYTLKIFCLNILYNHNLTDHIIKYKSLNVDKKLVEVMSHINEKNDINLYKTFMENNIYYEHRLAIIFVYPKHSLSSLLFKYFIDKTDAKAREEFLKSGYGREQLKNFLKIIIYLVVN
jgi:hypothetical protein